MPREVRLAALVLALAGCNVATTYVPRTPHTLALGVTKGEPAIYKDGQLYKISEFPAAFAACSAGATTEVGEADASYGGFRTNNAIALVAYALSAFVLPMLGVGIYFGVRAENRRSESYAHVVDAINRHNDEIGCVAR
jgi:hypothetical protein